MQNIFSEKQNNHKMPLTKKGKEALSRFKKRYGEKRGRKIFYSYMNKYPKRTKSWHRKSSSIK